MNELAHDWLLLSELGADDEEQELQHWQQQNSDEGE